MNVEFSFFFLLQRRSFPYCCCCCCCCSCTKTNTATSCTAESIEATAPRCVLERKEKRCGEGDVAAACLLSRSFSSLSFPASSSPSPFFPPSPRLPTGVTPPIVFFAILIAFLACISLLVSSSSAGVLGAGIELEMMLACTAAASPLAREPNLNDPKASQASAAAGEAQMRKATRDEPSRQSRRTRVREDSR